jgi:hypothetical protein
MDPDPDPTPDPTLLSSLIIKDANFFLFFVSHNLSTSKLSLTV